MSPMLNPSALSTRRGTFDPDEIFEKFTLSLELPK